MTTMRAKLQVGFVQEQFNWAPEGEPRQKSMEVLTMHAVAKSTAYPADGSDEDNTFAKWSPGANLSINIANPDLWGKFKVGDKYYVDFTQVTE
ncbi:hypothetical protein PQR64_30795 [Paraburkholderia phytofirmans]|uniref:hypothetical protein n=1 Tax=Paraburkholderia phytofirmans TaxID=261302 RepID=UPI0038BA5DF3